MEIIQNKRIGIVDALRGFALMGLLLIHAQEHYDFSRYPENPWWLFKLLDPYVQKITWFIFAGKAYAIFAFMFGLSFYIQISRQAAQNYDYRWRFLWRLLVLFIIGCVHCLIFPGDILVFYAFMGLFLVLVYQWNSKLLLAIAIICLLQPFEWSRAIYAILHPGFEPGENGLRALYDQQADVFQYGSLWDDIRFNATTGQKAKWWWYWQAGRFPQTLALFLFGMLAGRTRLFEHAGEKLRVWRRILIWGIVAFVPLYFCKESLEAWVPRQALLQPLGTIFGSLTNVAFMAVLMSLFVLLYTNNKIQKRLSFYEPFGKMSLTNYVGQSVICTPFFYGYGLAMYRYFGFTLSFLLAILVFILQVKFSQWWLKRHRRGPLEWLWYKATWIGRER